MKKSILSSMAVASMLLFVGCSGDVNVKGSPSMPGPGKDIKDSGNQDRHTPPPLRGKYVDSAVQGVSYHCGPYSGKTDTEGTFNFKENSTCTFKIGDVLLREAKMGHSKDLVTLVEDNIHVAKLLQTLDKDGNAKNGIQILDTVAALLKENNIDKIPHDNAVLDLIQSELRIKAPKHYRGHTVNDKDASDHLRETYDRLDREHKDVHNGERGSKERDHYRDHLPSVR